MAKKKAEEKDVIVIEADQSLEALTDIPVSEPIAQGVKPDKMKLTDVPGLGPKTASLLEEGGVTNPQQLMEKQLGELEALGVNRPIAKKLKSSIVELFPDLYEAYTEEMSLEDIEGIGPTTAKSLREKGVSLGLLETTPVKELEERYGLTTAAATKYQSFITENIRGGFFTNAFEVLEQQKSAKTFTFGVESLDNLTFVEELGVGGVRLGDTYEFFGAFRSGKSQLCHQLAVAVQLPEKLGGLGKKAIYIDTEGTFSPARIAQITEGFKKEKGWKVEVDDVLKNVMYARAKNSDIQQAIVIKLLEILSQSPDEYGILILDSVTAHFRAEYSGRGTLADRQQTLNGHLNTLHRLADTYNIAIVVTNQVQANPAQFFGDPTTAVGGNIMGHWAGTRFYLRKSKGDKRVIRVFDSPVLAESEAVFEITTHGLITSE